MYDLKFSEEQLNLIKKVNEFNKTEVEPGAKDRDKNYDFLGVRDLLKKMGKLGWMGIPYAKEYGGAGLGYLEYSMVETELSKVDGSLGIAYSVHVSLGTGPIYNFGDRKSVV